ncbi:MAG: hypothetical protein WD077_10860 [Bacteroidia bacterium]
MIGLKEKLISEINKIEDEKLLKYLLETIAFESDTITPFKLSDEQRMMVEEAREQYKRGEFMTDEQAHRLTEEWLRKR